MSIFKTSKIVPIVTKYRKVCQFFVAVIQHIRNLCILISIEKKKTSLMQLESICFASIA